MGHAACQVLVNSLLGVASWRETYHMSGSHKFVTRSSSMFKENMSRITLW